MKVLIFGGAGFIGSFLTEFLLEKGNRVSVIGRKTKPRTSVDFKRWDILKIPPVKLIEGHDAIVNLAGVSIFRRWSEKTKQEIYDSRVNGTKNLIRAIKKLGIKPKVFVCASAVGYYGDRNDEILTEDSKQGSGFLSQVCFDWEKEVSKAEDFGVRVVSIRTAPVLGNDGILKTLLPIYKLGLGGTIGSGKQYFPWIHVDDLVRTYYLAITDKRIKAAVNASSPNPTTYKQFSDTLAKVLNRPAFWRIPKFSLKLLYGDLADEITASQRVIPNKLKNLQFRFKFPKLQKALEDICTSSTSTPSPPNNHPRGGLYQAPW